VARAVERDGAGRQLVLTARGQFEGRRGVPAHLAGNEAADQQDGVRLGQHERGRCLAEADEFEQDGG